jgi:hypothetical protein
MLGIAGPYPRPWLGGLTNQEGALREFFEGLQRSLIDLYERWQVLSAEWPWWPELLPWLVALVLLLALLLLRRRPARVAVQAPALLITQGEVVLEGPVGERSRRGASPVAARTGTLTMTLSNLSRYPVQVLEVALRPSRTTPPRVAAVEALVPALASAEVSVEVPLQLAGDSWLEVYCYAAATRRKLHRHRAELVWEPWMQRFKVAPMDQVTLPVRRLASSEPRALFEIPQPLDRPQAPAPVKPKWGGVRIRLPELQRRTRPGATDASESLAVAPSATRITPPSAPAGVTPVPPLGPQLEPMEGARAEAETALPTAPLPASPPAIAPDPVASPAVTRPPVDFKPVSLATGVNRPKPATAPVEVVARESHGAGFESAEGRQDGSTSAASTATEGNAAGSGATDSLATDPLVTDSLVTDSLVTDPQVTDPPVTDPLVTDSLVMDPQAPDQSEKPRRKRNLSFPDEF